MDYAENIFMKNDAIIVTEKTRLIFAGAYFYERSMWVLVHC